MKGIQVVVLLCLAVVHAKLLVPDRELMHEEIFYEATNFYELSLLSPDTDYEVRISYPASTPTIFKIELVASVGTPAAEHGETKHLVDSRSTFRRVLNTEKIRLDAGQIFQGSPRVLQVTAHMEGVSPDVDRIKRPVQFNIVVETYVLGLPRRVHRLVVGIVVVLVAVWGLVRFWSRVPLFRAIITPTMIKGS
jgi:hypothetical protein